MFDVAVAAQSFQKSRGSFVDRFVTGGRLRSIPTCEGFGPPKGSQCHKGDAVTGLVGEVFDEEVATVGAGFVDVQ
jgi:hypothetical protein